jgi:hypothetical protein
MSMKQYALTALALFGTLGLGSIVSAQEALIAEPNVSVGATFYNGDPSGPATLLDVVRFNNSPGAVVIPDIATATYVILEFEGDSYAFEIAESGTNKNAVELHVGAEQDTMSLAEVVSGLVENPTLLEELAG